MNQWMALVAVEVGGVSSSPLVASAGNINTNTSTATDSDSTQTMSLGSSALIVAHGNSDETTTAPAAGTGFTAVSQTWNWQGREGTCDCPSALLESGIFGPGDVAATFTPLFSGDHIINLAIALH
jgi:hypothetical protein